MSRRRRAGRPAALAPRDRHGDEPGRRGRGRARRDAARASRPGRPGRTHGAQLLPAIGRLHGEANLRRSRIRGVIVGTGPGAFTGLRVGLATAKALAHELGVPIVGVSTGEALLAAAAAPAGPRRSLLLPAGPNDRLRGPRRGRRRGSCPAARSRTSGPGDVLVAVDLDGRAPADALARGERGPGRLRGGARPARAPRASRPGDADDLARLVPEYVSLPRGVARESGEVAWSRDPR